MEYKHLPFEEYFINTSKDFTHTGRVTCPIVYKAYNYYTGKLQKKLGLVHEVNYEIHYEPERDVIQLNFERTVGFSDWFANVFEFSSRYYNAIDFEGEPLQLRVHHGWGDMYLAVKRVIRSEWSVMHEEHPEAATEIIGWSLGSGIASLCCQDLNFNFGVKPYLITYGSVRPFKSARRDRERLRKYLDTLCEKCWNFADVNDLISYMPPFRGFMMIGRVDVGEEKRRSLFRMLHPLKYHTHYDIPELYNKLVKSGE